MASARRQRVQDALLHANVRAFLRAIRLGEGTSDERGYRRLIGGGEFSSFASHPNKLISIPRYGVKSTAAGAYQFIKRTWDSLVSQYGFEDFSPRCQDEGAVALIVEKGALDEVLNGNLREAVRLCAPIWASLPGSTAGQRTESFERVLAEYRKHGGYVA